MLVLLQVVAELPNINLHNARLVIMTEIILSAGISYVIGFYLRKNKEGEKR